MCARGRCPPRGKRDAGQKECHFSRNRRWIGERLEGFQTPNSVVPTVGMNFLIGGVKKSEKG